MPSIQDAPQSLDEVLKLYENANSENTENSAVIKGAAGLDQIKDHVLGRKGRQLSGGSKIQKLRDECSCEYQVASNVLQDRNLQLQCRMIWHFGRVLYQKYQFHICNVTTPETSVEYWAERSSRSYINIVNMILWKFSQESIVKRCGLDETDPLPFMPSPEQIIVHTKLMWNLGTFLASRHAWQSEFDASQPPLCMAGICSKSRP